MQKPDNLPEINISPWEGNYFIRYAIILIFIFQIIAFFSTEFVKLVFALLTLFVGWFMACNIFGRLSTSWRKLHYPLMCRYAAAVGFAKGRIENWENKFNINLIHQCLLQSVFPNVESKQIESLIKNILSQEMERLNSTEYIRNILIRKNSKIRNTDLDNLVSEKIRLAVHPPDEYHSNYIKTRLIIAFLIEKKYGKEEKLDYMYAVLTNEAR